MQTPYPYESGDSEILYITVHKIASHEFESAKHYFNQHVSPKKAHEKIANMLYIFGYEKTDVPYFTSILTSDQSIQDDETTSYVTYQN